MKRKLLKKIIKYWFWWAIAALLDLSLLWFFTEILGIYYLLSATFSFIIAFSAGFYYQKYITFESKSGKHVVEWLYFFIFQIIWLWLNIFLLWLFSWILWFDYMLIAIINKFIIFAWNFSMNYTFNFNH